MMNTIERQENRIEKFSPEIVEKLEKISFMTDSSRIDFLLVLLGEKPAANFGFSIRINSVNDKNEDFLKQKKMLEELIQESKLSFSPVEEETLVEAESVAKKRNIEEEVGRRECSAYVAGDTANLVRLKKALEENNTREIGLALGYPPTAVEAFCKGEPMDGEELLPLEIKYSEATDFLCFKMSKEHYAEEFEVVKRWATKIKENFPQFHKQVVDLRPRIDSLRLERPEEFKSFLNSEEKMAAIKQRDEKLYQELMQEKLQIASK